MGLTRSWFYIVQLFPANIVVTGCPSASADSAWIYPHQVLGNNLLQTARRLCNKANYMDSWKKRHKKQGITIDANYYKRGVFLF